MTGDLPIAIILAIALSFLIAVIEVKLKSNADLLTCVSGFFFFYFLILALGNTLTTLIASTSLAEYFPNEALGVSDSTGTSTAASEAKPGLTTSGEKTLILPGVPWLWYASVGVFGFELVLKNMNVTMFDKGVLTINDWIQKARDVTVADSIKSQTKKNVVEVNNVANTLRTKLSEQDLNTHAANAIGHDKVAELKERTANTGGDQKLALALAIANENANNAKAIIQAANS